MRKIIFNVPDNTEVLHVICVSKYRMADGGNGTNLTAEFYDLRTGKTEFTPDIRVLDAVTEIGAAQNKRKGKDDGTDA